MCNTYCKFSTCGPRTSPHESWTNIFGQPKTDYPPDRIKISTLSAVRSNWTLQMRAHRYVFIVTRFNTNLNFFLLLVETLLPFYNLYARIFLKLSVTFFQQYYYIYPYIREYTTYSVTWLKNLDEGINMIHHPHNTNQQDVLFSINLFQ